MGDRKTGQTQDLGQLCGEFFPRQLRVWQTWLVIGGHALLWVALAAWWPNWFLLSCAAGAILGFVGVLHLDHRLRPRYFQIFEQGYLYAIWEEVEGARWDEISRVEVDARSKMFRVFTKRNRAHFFSGSDFHWSDLVTMIETTRSHVSALASPPEWAERS